MRLIYAVLVYALVLQPGVFFLLSRIDDRKGSYRALTAALLSTGSTHKFLPQSSAAALAGPAYTRLAPLPATQRSHQLPNPYTRTVLAAAPTSATSPVSCLCTNVPPSSNFSCTSLVRCNVTTSHHLRFTSIRGCLAP